MIKEILVKNAENNVIRVIILPHKDTGKYSFINMSKGHICPCQFDSIDDAMVDLESKLQAGSILGYKVIRG
ncbi:MAG: hypothetical protein RR346_03820 [Bacteroidales bacterium]